MRNVKIAPGEYYHLYNRGVQKQEIFFDERDYVRFLFLILYFQSLHSVTNVGLHTSNFIKHSVFNISKKQREKIISERRVALASFCLMPNHFHLLVYEKDPGGIARYMQRILNAYTKYINTRYKKSGHLFQGPYQAVHVGSNEQLLHLSSYIHRNPRELTHWKNREERYPWSSYQDYISDNRWEELLENGIVLEQFSDKNACAEFFRTSTAKEFPF